MALLRGRLPIRVAPRCSWTGSLARRVKRRHGMVTTRKHRGMTATLLLALFFGCALALGVGATPARAASISGRVVDDTNLNHQVDASDRPLAQVEIHLLNAAGAPLSSTHTHLQGAY